jgi:hypothetical protein
MRAEHRLAHASLRMHAAQQQHAQQSKAQMCHAFLHRALLCRHDSLIIQTDAILSGSRFRAAIAFGDENPPAAKVPAATITVLLHRDCSWPYRNLEITHRGAVHTIIVNRPDKLNALNRDTLNELTSRLRRPRRTMPCAWSC